MKGRVFLVVTHEGVAKMLQVVSRSGTEKDFTDVWDEGPIETAGIRRINFSALPKNELNELDLHRPFIDEITFTVDGVVMRRVPDVFDCWFESGSMPFASKGFVFDSGKECPEYPAEFIAEGLDQTRGWFYSMLVLGTALFGQSPYKNVVVNGLVLAEDGKKMSKSLNNYPPLAPLLEKYGVDAIRYFLLSSPSVKAEDTAFSEKAVDDVIKKHFNRLYNVISLYDMYKDDATNLDTISEDVLDVWIMALLAKTAETITSHLDHYELDKATKLLGDFIEDLSVWYIRRSRDRFKSENELVRNQALSTTRFVLIEFSKLMAPFVPFLAEDVYGRMMGTILHPLHKKESVHLEEWPMYAKDKAVNDEAVLALDQMTEVRKIVSLALEARSKVNIKVRQPLARLMLRTDEKSIADDDGYYLELIKDEVNVKEVILNSDIEDDVMLDITLSPDLVKEGVARELLRFIQELRKKSGLSPKDAILLTVDTDEAGINLIRSFREEMSRTARIADILFEKAPEGETLSIEDYSFNILIKKV